MTKVNFGVFDTPLPHIEPGIRYRGVDFVVEARDSSWMERNLVYRSIGLVSFKKTIYVVARTKGEDTVYMFRHEDIIRLQERKELFDRLVEEEIKDRIKNER